MIQCMYSMVAIDALNKDDTVAQIARCSFDVHVLDILGTLVIGGTVIMLHPEGILDMEYLATQFLRKQITYVLAVPSLLRAFFTFLVDTRGMASVRFLRSPSSSGK